MTTITTAEILQDAATLIRRGGLSQGAYARTGGGFEIGAFVKSPAKRYSLQGAMLIAYESVRSSGRVVLDDGPRWRSAVEDELARRGWSRDIDEFSDTPGRTAEDVAELLETVARTVENHAKRKTA